MKLEITLPMRLRVLFVKHGGDLPLLEATYFFIRSLQHIIKEISYVLSFHVSLFLSNIIVVYY